MPRAVSSDVAVTYGFITVLADLYSAKATDTDSALTQLCAGHAGAQHDPEKPRFNPICPKCGEVGRSDLVKGSEVAKGTYVVFDASEVSAMKGDDETYKGKIALTAHDAVEVEANTMPSGTVYYLAPGKKDQFYSLLREMVLDTPDLAYVGLYTVRTRAAMYRVRPMERGGQTILLAEQLLRPAEVSDAPAVTTVEVPQQMREMALQVARGFVVPFDPDTFRDTYKDRLAAAVAEREGQEINPLAPTTAGVIAAVDPMAAMQAQMATFLATQTGSVSDPPPVTEKKPARKRAPKKEVAA